MSQFGHWHHFPLAITMKAPAETVASKKFFRLLFYA
jgi:hypothetical protein